MTIIALALGIVGTGLYLVPASRDDMPRRILYDNAGGTVVFEHARHVTAVAAPSGQERNCAACHHESPVARDKPVACASCHGAKNEVAYPSIEQCSKCHNPADMEKKTKDMKPSNPHTSPHYGNQLDCVNCHVQHGETVNFCDQCHTFGFKVP